MTDTNSMAPIIGADQITLLERLSNACAVSGDEGEVRTIVGEQLKPVADEYKIDALGNVIVRRKARQPDALKVLVAAHMDEVGLIVKHIDDRGFIRFAAMGGFYAPTLLSQRVVLHANAGLLYGVIGGKPPHMMDEDERKKGVKVEDMFIDIGAINKEEVANLGIEAGTSVTIDREFRELANSRVTGKAFDNRAGVAMLIKTLQTVKSPHTIYGVFTVQEEVGTRGAQIAANRIHPDLALVASATGRVWLATEIVSSDDHAPDTVIKKQIYEEHKLPRLWMVDPRYDNVEVYHASEYGLVLKQILAGHEMLTEKLLPEFQLTVEELFRTDGNSR